MLPPVFLSVNRFLPLLTVALLPFLALAPASASSILVVGTPADAAPETAGSARVGAESRSLMVVAEPQRHAATPEACAAAFHARLATIARTEFAALKAAAGAETEVSADAETRLPGALLFPVTETGGNAPERRAAKAAAALARSRGAGAVDGNGKWVLARLREDLGDYLGQKPSPFLCSGVANYLATLRGFAEGALPSSARRKENFETGRGVASQALSAADDALRPAPVPSPAPAGRPAPDELRPTVDAHAHPDQMAAPDQTGSVDALAAAAVAVTPVATTPVATIDVAAAGGSIDDPDLPPLPPPLALDTEADILRAIDALVAKAETSGHLAPAGVEPLSPAAEPDPSGWEPVPRRLAALRPRLGSNWSRLGDHLVEARVATALGDLEALDYLRRAAERGGDPVAEALERVFAAIETAHASAAAGEDAAVSAAAPGN